MSYLDDLKKKGQNLVQNVQNVANGVKKTAQNVYNGAKTVYDTVQGAKKEYNDFKNYQSQQNQQPQQTTMGQQETDWLAEYDSYKADEEAKKYSAGAQGAVGGQAANVTSAAQAALGEGAGQWKSELDGIMNKILNGEKFSYDMNGDAMYQQMADTYKNQANLAMQNSMAQAAAMTGGYGSSYGQMVGQQAFAGQMQGLNDIGMDLYNQALNEYIAEGDRLNNQYAMLADRENTQYGREYQEDRDAVNDSQWNKSFEYQQGRDDVADKQWSESMQYQKDRDDVADKQWSESMQYQKDRDAVADSQWEQSFGYQQDRDQVADAQWQAELDRYLANDETSKEQWQAEMDRALANDELAAEQWDKAFAADEEQRGIDNAYRDAALAEDQRQFDESLDWDKAVQEYMYGEDGFYVNQREDEQAYNTSEREATQDYNTSEREASQDFTKNENALNRTHDVTMQNDAQLHQSDMYDKEFDNMYGENGFYTKQNAQEQENWQAEFDREGEWYADAQEAANPNTTYEGEGDLNGQSVPKQLAGVQGLTTTNPGLFDDNGYFKQAAVVNANDNGSMTYNIGGKNVSVQKGTSPYTNTKNPDAKNGTFDNGYQPDNVGGQKLTELSGQEAMVNGQWVPIYSTPDGKEWVYDAANNEYFVPDSEEIEKTEPTKITLPTPTSGKANVEMKPTGFR